MVAWLGVWAVIHWLWRERNIHFRRVAVATVVLVIVGLLGTFPPVYDFDAELVRKSPMDCGRKTKQRPRFIIEKSM